MQIPPHRETERQPIPQVVSAIFCFIAPQKAVPNPKLIQQLRSPFLSARIRSYPQTSTTLVEQTTYDAYAKDLSSPLLNFVRDKPNRRYANSFLIGKDQNDFLEIFDHYLEALAASSETAKIIGKFLEPREQIGI